MKAADTIATIGYQGVTADTFIAALKANRIDFIIDVRAVPLSRKPGFSKNRLASILAENGIGYVNLKGLGTPVEGRVAARAGRTAEMRAIYTEHLKTAEARLDLKEAATIARTRHACLLCFEHDPKICHRALIVQRVARANKQHIAHLDPALGQFL